MVVPKRGQIYGENSGKTITEAISQFLGTVVNDCCYRHFIINSFLLGSCTNTQNIIPWCMALREQKDVSWDLNFEKKYLFITMLWLFEYF